jgi:hypothetical protein
MARRFAATIPSGILPVQPPVWQLENELHYAYLTSLAGERSSYLDGIGVHTTDLSAVLVARLGDHAPTLRAAEAVLRARAALPPPGTVPRGVRTSMFVQTLMVQAPEVLADLRNASWISAITGQWGNDTYLTELLSVLRQGVRDEYGCSDAVATSLACANSSVTTNFFTSIPPGVDELAGMWTWTKALAEWCGLLDVVSVDVYPNAVAASPVMGDSVGAAVAQALQILGPDNVKPTWVMETGYHAYPDPAPPPSQNFPSTNFSESNQALYFSQAFTSAAANGSIGFLAFGLWPGTGVPIPPGGFTEDDSEALEVLNAVVQNGTDAIGAAMLWLADNAEYAESRLPALLFNVSNHFGLFTETGQPYQAASLLRRLYST